MKLQNQIAIVAGAGSAMGSVIAGAFAVEGAKVIAADMDEERLRAYQSALGDVPGEIVPQRVDVTRPDSMHGLMEETIERYGRLDILVYSADVSASGKTGDAWWREVLDVHLVSAVEASQQGLRRMSAQEEGGCIILVAPTEGEDAVLTACRLGIVGLVRAIGRQYAGCHVRCNALCPGNLEMPEGSAEPPQCGIRRGTPEEVAAAALFLACEEAGFVNGAVLTVDGGAK